MFVCSSMSLRIQTGVNTLGLPCKLHMLLKFTMAWSKLKMECLIFIVTLHGQSKEFHYISACVWKMACSKF